jgi:hypothetical protein
MEAYRAIEARQIHGRDLLRRIQNGIYCIGFEIIQPNQNFLQPSILKIEIINKKGANGPLFI